MRTILAIGLLALVSCAAGAEFVERDDWADHFPEGSSGTFVLHELGSDSYEIYNLDRADTPYLPASTFKILNSMVSMQTGVVSSVDEVFAWSGEDHGLAAWNRNHSLRTGIEVSAVWLFQQVAQAIGQESMAMWVQRSQYGNADIGSDIDSFWLDGDLRTTAIEQVDFLTRLANRELPFDRPIQDSVAEIIVREADDYWSFSHKTGTTLRTDPPVGWLVGLTTHESAEWVFALNLDLDSQVMAASQLDPEQRIHIARSILESEGALPAGTSQG